MIVSSQFFDFFHSGCFSNHWIFSMKFVFPGIVFFCSVVPYEFILDCVRFSLDFNSARITKKSFCQCYHSFWKFFMSGVKYRNRSTTTWVLWIVVSVWNTNIWFDFFSEIHNCLITEFSMFWTGFVLSF